MTLRINGKSNRPTRNRAVDDENNIDNWSDRVVKLIPAEALGLYGAGSAIVPDDKVQGLWILSVACFLVTIIFRYQATRGSDGKPQLIAIAISVISFALWLVALSPPVGPFDLGENAYLGALFALIWGVMVPAFYKGD